MWLIVVVRCLGEVSGGTERKIHLVTLYIVSTHSMVVLHCELYTTHCASLHVSLYKSLR